MKNKEIKIYGYSDAFGRGNHQLTLDLILQTYPNYEKEKCNWSNEGY